MTARPLYKKHPLWTQAMTLTRDAYAISESFPGGHGASRSLRKAAVVVPARVAEALLSRGRERYENGLAARGALAELARQAGLSPSPEARALAVEAEKLDRSILFELATPEDSWS